MVQGTNISLMIIEYLEITRVAKEILTLKKVQMKSR